MIEGKEIFIGSGGDYSEEKEEKFKELARPLVEFAHQFLNPDERIIIDYSGAYIDVHMVELKYIFGEENEL